MKSGFPAALVAATLLLAGLAVNAQSSFSNAGPLREARESAVSALGTLRSMVTADNYASLGFQSPREAESATIGEPIPVYMVQLDELRAYQAGQDPAPLLRPAQRWIYPVLVGGQVRSSITVERVGDKLSAVGFGGAKLIAALSAQRDQSALASGTPAAGHAAIHVAALGAYFIARPGPGGVIVTPIVDDARADLKAGASLSLADAMARLGNVARTYNGLPM